MPSSPFKCLAPPSKSLAPPSQSLAPPSYMSGSSLSKSGSSLLYVGLLPLKVWLLLLISVVPSLICLVSSGAVCFGLDPTVVSVRRCRLTYGVGVLNRFVPDKHPKSKMVVKEGVQWCMDVFDKFVEADQPVTVGNTAVRSYAPAKPGQKSTIIHIYCSEKSDVRFITDPGVRRCGTLCLDLSDVQYHHGQKQRRREIQARMTFGDTEIKVTALDVATGKCVKSTIDFLSK